MIRTLAVAGVRPEARLARTAGPAAGRPDGLHLALLRGPLAEGVADGMRLAPALPGKAAPAQADAAAVVALAAEQAARDDGIAGQPG